MTFLPCPYCGRALTTRDLRIFDQDSYLGDMEMVHDFEHILDPSNACIPEDWEGMDEEDRQRVGKLYQETVETVEDIQLHCTCGASITVDRWKTCYPEEGWLEEFEFLVNRRSVRAMETTLNHLIDKLPGGLLRQRYQDALTALQAVRRIQEGQEKFEEIMGEEQ